MNMHLRMRLVQHLNFNEAYICVFYVTIIIVGDEIKMHLMFKTVKLVIL